MSNNLRQIAKDLRSFVKRCKDVHYSDSLLITFLVTGLLTLAPKTLSADAIQEQQEVSAQAYDTITDLRQSFLRARQENEKSIKGAERELVMLMEQGDQVIKSPWASFQFATGFTNNDWRTSYRGRGGKYLEYYRRNNDLTKYVFDASKHQYGATNLHVQRNQEPNTLEINPANVHEPYRPYVPERLDAMVLPTDVNFNIDETNFVAGRVATNYNATNNPTAPSALGNTHNMAHTTNTVNLPSFANNYNPTYTTNTVEATNQNTTGNTGSSHTSKATLEIPSSGNSLLYTGNRWWGSSNAYSFANADTVSGGTFDVGGTYSNNSWWTGYSWWNWWYTGEIRYSGVKINGSGGYGGIDDIATYGAPGYSVNDNSFYDVTRYAAQEYARIHDVDYWTAFNTVNGNSNHIRQHQTYVTGTGWVNDYVEYNVNGSWLRAPSTATYFSGSYNHTPVDAAILANKAVEVKDVTFNVNSGDRERNGIVAKAKVTMTGTNNFNITGDESNGVVVAAGGSIDSTGTKIDINADKVNGINITNAASGASKVTDGHIKINSGTENNGIYVKAQNLDTKSVEFLVNTTNGLNNAIYNETTGTLSDEDSDFTVNGSKNNAIYTKAGTVKTKNTTFKINGTTLNNGIHAATGSTAVEVKNDNYTQNFTLGSGLTESNGIYVNAGTLKVEKVGFLVNGANADLDKNNAIYIDAAGGQADITDDSRFFIYGDESNGILAAASSSNKVLNVTDSSFTVGNGSGTPTGTQKRNNGVYTKRELNSTRTSYTVNGTNSNGIYADGEGSGKKFTVNGGTFTINGSYNNGIINKSHIAGSKVLNAAFKVQGTNNNGVYLTRNTQLAEISDSSFTVGDTNVGIHVGDNRVATEKAKVLDMKNTSIDVTATNATAAGDNNGTGIYIYNGDVKFGEGSSITGNGNDVLITFDTPNNKSQNTLEFGGTATNPTKLTTTAANSNNNIGINLQRGTTTDTEEITIKGNVDITFGDSVNKGNNNSVYKVNSYIKKLELWNGDSGTSATALGKDNVATTTGKGVGKIFVRGNNNAIYDGLAYVESGNITLSDAQMVGSNNAIINLQGPTVAVDSSPTTAPVGAFGGEIRVQGAIGGDFTQYGINSSENNVAIYAASGQNDKTTKSNISDLTGALKNVDVKDLNVGFGSASKQGTLIYAVNGTGVDAATTTKYHSKTDTTKMSTAAITDGVVSGGSEATTRRGYNTGTVKYSDTSYQTIMGYADGVLKDTSKYALGAGSMFKKPSTINFKNDVDMVAKEGIAFYAKNGGYITLTGNARAGGSKSVVAFATGSDVVSNPGNPGQVSNSLIEIDKNITAADYLLLGDLDYRSNYEKTLSYKNVGAFAENGGIVRLKGAIPAAKSAEIDAYKSSDGENETKQSSSSLIYGIGAYATGAGSLVDIQGSSGKGIHVVTGSEGGIYATNKGQVNFTGFLTHQNNIVENLTSSSGDIVSSHFDSSHATNFYATSTTVKRKGILGTGNDHENKTPFFVKRTGPTDKANINFTGKTYIAMYDGILYSGNQYGQGIWGNNDNLPLSDYSKYSTRPSGADASEWDAAKYRGMENVTTYISNNKSEHGGVNIGVINQAKEEIEWDAKQAGGNGSQGYLKGIGTDYKGMKITNIADTRTTEHGINGDQWEIYSTLINDRLKITQDVVIEDFVTTKDSTQKAVVSKNDFNDPFNDIAMESTRVTIDGAKMTGDATYRDLGPFYAKNYQRNNVGFAMGNSLNRWNDLTISANTPGNWRKTKNTESGITNSGTVDIWGGSDSNTITGLLVNFGTLKNGDGTSAKKGVIRVDHGYALVGTDGSIIHNLKDSQITVTGKYAPPSKGSNIVRSDETTSSGENYGIVGISDTPVNYNTANSSGIGNDINKIEIRHEDAKIYVEGEQAVGIYGENRNNALATDVTIDYINTNAGATGIDVSNPNMTSATARGIGIALVNGSSTTYANGWDRAGGVIKLTGSSAGDLGTAAISPTTTKAITTLGSLGLNLGKNDILTGKNGVGIYAESADIQVLSDKFTVLTKDNGVGLWAMDDTHIAVGADHDKTFQYNYNGANDKNGFAMAFGGKNTDRGYTTASNYMDIKFSNRGDNNKQLNLQKEATLPATSGTTKGIAGILVNTNDAGDRVINKGHIEEHKSSVTNLRAYGAVVNKGTFENWGDIKLNESLMPSKASDVKTADMKKVNVGIMANDHSANARYNTYIENYGDITIGDVKDGANSANQDTNIGSWAIYGYNVKTGAKADGTDSTYRINKNSYGIYSGDGNVQIQKGTKIYVGNDTVLGHKQNTQTIDGVTYTIDRQNGNYATDAQLLSGLDTPRERDSSIGVYIDNNRRLSDTARNVEVSADMNIDRFSHGIVLAEKDGGQMTNVTIGSASNSPQIKVAWSTDDNKGKHVHSEKPHEDPKLSKEVEEQGNAVYYYSADNRSHAVTYADVKMDGDYNTAYFTKGSVDNYGTIDLRSQYDVEKRLSDPNHKAVGYGSVGIISENTADPSINRGTITTGLSDTQNMMYSVGMGAGRNYYRTNNKGESVYDRTEGQGYVVNEGTINVQEDAGIGMLATGKGSKAINRGTINLIGDNAIGMYIDREAVGINEATGVIKGNAQNLKGVIAINGGYIKNYGTITVEGSGSKGIVTDSSKFTLDANGNPVAYITDTSSAEYKAGVTAGEANGHGHADLYGGTETSIEEGTSGNPKTTGVGTTITRPDIVPLTTITVDGIPTPIYELENDASRPGQWAETIEVRNSIQTGENGEPLMGIGLWTRDEYGNPAWPRYRNEQLSEVTSVGMYVDTSGVKYTNPINGLDNLPRLGKVNLYFGPEITEYTNSKAIRIGDRIEKDASGNDIIIKSNILKPFNDALRRLPGGATVNALSSSLTWQVSANIDDNNQISELYMSKVPYHSFAYDDDKSLVNFTNNLDNIYEIARRGSEEKMIFNKLNSLGNGEGHILAQAFDQMRGHIYGGIQQRTKSTSDILSNEVGQLRSETNGSKDSNKFKAFGQRNEYKTDTAGIPDWKSNAGGMVYVHEDETVKLGEKSGFYAGVTNNYFTFKDLARSYENQAMAKAGVFKQTPLDENGTFTITVGGEGFFGRTDTKRRFWVVDKEFRAKSNYYTYGAGLNANLEKVFRINQGFSIVPSVGLNFEYGRFSTVNEDGDMALKVKSDDYYSIKPKAGIDFRYSQPVFKNSKFTASLGFSYENELGRLNEVENEARIKGAWTDYYTIKGDKEDRRGNFKSDLKLGLDNGRLGMTVNTGYDTKGHNFRAGLGLKVMY